MCKYCATIIHEMGILSTDLPYVPYKKVKWMCIVPGCKGGCKVRDYGVPGFYYWPVKIKYSSGGYRGGWIAIDHAYMCSKHFRPIMKRQFPIPVRTPEILASHFIVSK